MNFKKSIFLTLAFSCIINIPICSMKPIKSKIVNVAIYNISEKQINKYEQENEVDIAINDLIIALRSKTDVIIVNKETAYLLAKLSKNIANNKDPERYLPQYYKLSDFINNNYKIYRTEEHDFAIFAHANNTKQAYGLSKEPKRLTEISFEQAEDLLNYKSTFPDPDPYISLENIFDTTNNPQKIVYLAGHGTTTEPRKIAGLLLREYEDVITSTLPNINCIFLYVVSCYAAGKNIIKIFERVSLQNQRAYEDLEITFPIAIGAISDITARQYENKNLAHFFDAAQRLFLTRAKDIQRKPEEKAEPWVSRKQFLDIVKTIEGGHLCNKTLIRLPGIRQFFRSADVDDEVLAITYPYLIAHELGIKTQEDEAPYTKAELKAHAKKLEEYKKNLTKKTEEATKKEKELREKTKEIAKGKKITLSPEDVKEFFKQKTEEQKEELEHIQSKKLVSLKKQASPIETKDKTKTAKKTKVKKAILLYPTVLLPELKIIGRKVPALISMFPGDAIHFIKKIDASNIPLDRLIKEMFAILKIKSNKLFLIDTILCKNYKGSVIPQTQPSLTLKQCYIKKRVETRKEPDSEKDKNIFIVQAFFTIEINKKHIYFSVTYDSESDKLITTEEKNDYAKTIIDAIQKNCPTRAAFIEATGGIETPKTLLNALKNHFDLFKNANYKKELDALLKQKMVQKS